MTGPIQKQRLDQILISEGLVSEDQIKEALMRQKAHGGKLGSQLLYHRYLDEAGLVKALTRQFGCEGVVLSKLTIPEEILKFIPKKVAVARKVMPFGYDPDANVLKIACEDPRNESLIQELEFVARGKEIKLYIAAELALNTAIARHYMGREVSLDDNLLIEIPEEVTETGGIKIPVDIEPETGPVPKRGSILLVTDEEFTAPMLQSILERDDYEVTITDSADEAIEMIGDRQFHSVLIKDTVSGDYLDLIDRLRKTSPRTVVRYYESSASLVLNEDAASTEGELLLKNLELFTSLLSSKDKLEFNHSGTVGKYVNMLCRKLGLPDKERLMITNAGFVHDLAKFYYSHESGLNPRELIQLTAKHLESLNYSPVIAEMLRSMYINLGGKYTKRLPIEVLGGNILTIVDIFCDNVPSDERLSLDKFEAVKKKFRDLTGKLFLQEVVEACIVMVQEEILSRHISETPCQVMLYSRHNDMSYPLELRIKNEGFRVMSNNAIEAFCDLYNRSRPDIEILLLSGSLDDIQKTITEFNSRGVDFSETPTFLLVDTALTSKLTGYLEQGVADILPLDGSTELLIVKMQKIQLSLDDQRSADSDQQPAGTTGRLSDMNLIDLLQALGPSRKTVKMTVTPNIENGGKLLLYLDQGTISYAEYLDKLGTEAVYDAIGWTDGTWRVEPVAPGKLPQPNNELSNESILMEGCRLLDERARQGQVF